MPRVWIALFFGYNGSGYNGMQHQKQEHVVTIQNQLIPLLFKNGYLPTDNYTQLQRKQKYSRAARTDKGVHAVFNGISCNFTIDKKYFDESNLLLKNKLHLDLREVFSNTKLTYHCFKKVSTRFEMRQLIHARNYSYICPLTYFPDDSSTSEQKLEKINKCAFQFKGTHNFHNYTRGLKATDPQAKRYIIEVKGQIFCEKFVKFNIIGQSFVYNQIRKMIGAIIFVFLHSYPAQFIGNTFYKNQFHLPTAPAEGLFLKSVDFSSYNKKKQIPEKLEFDDEQTKKSASLLESQIQKFIIEAENNVWNNWYSQTKEGKVIIPDDDSNKNEPQKGEGA